MHKVVYLSVAGATLILGISLVAGWYLSRITFECVSVADSVDGSWEQEWESSDRVTVYESKIYYPSGEGAKAAFAKQLEGASNIVERERLSVNGAEAGERVVAVFTAQASERAVSIIELQDKSIYCVEAPSVRDAFAFEEYRERERE